MIIVNNRAKKEFSALYGGDIFSLENEDGVIQFFMKTEVFVNDEGYAVNTVDLQFGELSFTENEEQVSVVMAKLVIE